MKKGVLLILSISVAFVGVLSWANWPIEDLPNSSKADKILVEKGNRILKLLKDGEIIRSYQISLGRSPIGPKEKEGDKKTPEGTYKIIEHFEHSAFYRSLRISYPDQGDIERAKKKGILPGSDIMIHGMRNGFGLIGRAHLWFDWTAGCIAVTNSEIDQIWNTVDDGTEIEIRE